MIENPEQLAIDRLRHRGAVVKQRKDESAGAISCRGLADRVDDAVLEDIAVCARLRELDLADSAVTDAGLASLTGLTRLSELDLSRTRVTAQGVERFAGLPRLKLLVVTGCPIDAERLRELRKRMINTRIVYA